VRAPRAPDDGERARRREPEALDGARAQDVLERRLAKRPQDLERQRRARAPEGERRLGLDEHARIALLQARREARAARSSPRHSPSAAAAARRTWVRVVERRDERVARVLAPHAPSARAAATRTARSGRGAARPRAPRPTRLDEAAERRRGEDPVDAEAGRLELPPPQGPRLLHLRGLEDDVAGSNTTCVGRAAA